MRGFGRWEFQLTLLRRIADYQPDLVTTALDQLDATAAQLLASHRHWQALAHSRRFPSDVRRYLITLGQPDTKQAVPIGDVTCNAYRWALPRLWPDLQGQAFADHDGRILNEWLVRTPGLPSAALPDITALAPWSCVVADVISAHLHARHLDPVVPSRWALRIIDQDHLHQLTFVWGLLQTVKTSARRHRQTEDR